MNIPLPKEELELFKQLKDLKVIFDVGAREDTYYLDLWSDSKHHLFEPNSVFANVLKEKTQNKNNVFINEFGLGDREREQGYQIGLQSFIDSLSVNDFNATKDMILSIKTLDGYVKEHDIKQIDFLKIDTEGYDFRVLVGAKNSLSIIRFIQYEHWGQVDNKEIKQFLGDRFEVESIGYRNMLCMNKELVSENERARLREYIINNKLGGLV